MAINKVRAQTCSRRARCAPSRPTGTRTRGARKNTGSGLAHSFRRVLWSHQPTSPQRVHMRRGYCMSPGRHEVTVDATLLHYRTVTLCGACAVQLTAIRQCLASSSLKKNPLPDMEPSRDTEFSAAITGRRGPPASRYATGSLFPNFVFAGIHAIASLARTRLCDGKRDSRWSRPPVTRAHTLRSCSLRQ